MGMVLSFQPRKAALPRLPLKTSAEPSVVIFPGVRYERLGGHDAALASLRAAEAAQRLQAPTKP